MRRVIGVAMMIDGVLQAMGVAGMVSTFADRSLRDQSLSVLHFVLGSGLVIVGQRLIGSGDRLSKIGCYVLGATLGVSLIETTWFNWTETAVRAGYTAVAIFVLLRKTTLPTT